jgi:hypothetical protein
MSTGRGLETKRVDLVLLITVHARARKCAPNHDVTSYWNEASEYLADLMP